MKKHALLSAIICSVALMIGSAAPAMADSVKVVTLGADLTDAQKNTMLKYFKVDSNQVQILTITNADEREHLSKYFSSADIGIRTLSCAYVKPTSSGGIKVRTANLNKVTCNMIASILSTSGVANCEVVAACPLEVSGTGALTGIMMAYETASGEKLDEVKKDIATQELAVTGDLAAEVGQNDATTVINQSKMEVVGNDIHNGDEIYNTVVNVSQENGIWLTDEQVNRIVSLLEDIAEQDYDYNEMKETLENVEENVTGEVDPDDGEELVPIEEDPDSIITDLDESILGDDVIAGSTEDPTVAEQSIDVIDDDQWDVVFGDDEEEETPEATSSEEIVDDEFYEGETYDELNQTGDTEEELDIDSLDATELGLFNHAESFTQGEYEGNTAALQSELGDDAFAIVTLDTETGKKLSKEVLKIYFDILKNGTDSYVWADTDIYMTTELNMLDQQFRKLFTIDEAQLPEGTEDILADVSQEDKNILYTDTMNFFKKLYHESDEEFYSEEPIEEDALDEEMEEEVYE